MDVLDLTGRNALVFGVANHRSIAWGIARELAARGARMAFAYQTERFRDPLEKLVEEAGMKDAVLVQCDVTDDAQIDSCFAEVREKMGHLDMLAHCIAFANREDLEGHFYDTSREGWRVALDISAYSLVALTHRAVPLMEGRNGSIITLSFMAAGRAVPNYNVMSAAKAALEQSVRQLAYELGPSNIRVNTISAGPVSTFSARGIRHFVHSLHYHAKKAPLRRNVTLEDIGRTALYLLTDLSSGVTGETIFVDCGFNIVGMD